MGLTETSKSSRATELTVITGFLALKTVRPNIKRTRAMVRMTAVMDEQMMMHRRRLSLRVGSDGAEVGTGDLRGCSSFFSMSIDCL
ncbi:hypothetical protein HanXRQr2_Chr01g0000561 [Helianthus annuus]|uniref:Uncharacterized protein n=1 Tax=Helianthus annuus TaxID=4232 RepID=A0A9K3JS71_HELAN|nr:hypothetical protein HanXRQr2_Chr01g0000561 [Helianthus annuus]